MKVTSFWLACIALIVGSLLVLPSWGQDAPAAGGGGGGGNAGGGGGGGNGGGGAGGGGRFGGGGFNPQQMQQRMMDNIKTQLAATDDEWAAIQPKLQAVTTARTAAQTGGMRGMFGGGGRGNRGGGAGGAGGGAAGGAGGAAAPATTQPLSPVAQAAKDLQTVLANKDAKPDDIKTALQGLRDAKAKAQDTLKAAQKDLTSILTQRQEAVLVGMGILE